MNQNTEVNDLILKKYEELYILSKSELEKAHTRFISVEEKATRHFTLLVVLLGLLSIGIPELVAIIKAQTTLWHTSFSIMYIILALNVLVSVFYYMKAVSFTSYKNIVIDQAMFDHFNNNKYVDVIYSLSKRIAEDIGILNNVTDKKINKATIAFKLTHFSILLIALTISLYIIIKLY